MSRTTSQARSHRFQPHVESLEERCVPAIALLPRPSTAILIGLLRPVDKAKIDPQPEPPKPAPNAILIGLLRPVQIVQGNYFKVDPQPEPPTRPVLNGILLPSLLPGAGDAMTKPSAAGVTLYFSQVAVAG